MNKKLRSYITKGKQIRGLGSHNRQTGCALYHHTEINAYIWHVLETRKEAGEMFRLSYRIKKKNNGPYEADSNQTACDEKMFLPYRAVSRAFICDHSNYADLFQNHIER